MPVVHTRDLTVTHNLYLGVQIIVYSKNTWSKIGKLMFINQAWYTKNILHSVINYINSSKSFTNQQIYTGFYILKTIIYDTNSETWHIYLMRMSMVQKMS